MFDLEEYMLAFAWVLALKNPMDFSWVTLFRNQRSILAKAQFFHLMYGGGAVVHHRAEACDR